MFYSFRPFSLECNLDFLHTLTSGCVCLAWHIDRCAWLPWQYAQLQFLHILRQSPQTEEEWTSVLEIICHQLSVCIKSGAVTLILYAK